VNGKANEIKAPFSYHYLFKISFALAKSLSLSLGFIIPVSNLILGVRKLASGRKISNKHGSSSVNHSE
jgi:hypothetical protein